MDNTPIIDVGDEPDTSGIDPQEEAFYEATGEDKEGYTKRHLAKLEDSPDLAVQIQTETRKRELLTAYIEANMKEGMDFYKLTIQGRESKPSLSKSGSEKFLSLFALQARFKKDDQTWEMLGRPAGVICYVCELYAKHGTLVGEGRGARAVDKDRDVNKAIKMAAKSAQIDAILRTGALSLTFRVNENRFLRIT
jgi:hypothetical protein